MRGLKALTSKPVVGVGRFTSPDTMVRMVRDGVLDMIGAARPSIADPFLPVKLEQGRYEDIRECIGCNICVSGDFTISPIRCTQNPSMGEEWRRGWHPERIRPSQSEARVLVVGAGPAGLEAAMMLGRRGYEVVLAEAGAELGGRVAREARLPGLAAWIRVLDYRKSQLERLGNVELAFDSELDADEMASYGFDHVAVATGAGWRRDGVARWHTHPIELDPELPLLTPDDVMAGTRPQGERVAIFDDDHYYMGGALAELLVSEGRRVTLVTPSARVSEWADHTMEQERIQGRLIELGVELLTAKALLRSHAGGVGDRACAYTGRESELDLRRAAAGHLAAAQRRPRPSRWRRPAARCGRSAMRSARAPSRRRSGTAAASPRSWTRPRPTRIRVCSCARWSSWRRSSRHAAADAARSNRGMLMPVPAVAGGGSAVGQRRLAQLALLVVVLKGGVAAEVAGHLCETEPEPLADPRFVHAVGVLEGKHLLHGRMVPAPIGGETRQADGCGGGRRGIHDQRCRAQPPP